MSKHTPGPWKWNGHELIGADDSTVCDDGSAYGEYSEKLPPDSADARLIEAAPELLEALIAARDALAAAIKAAWEGTTDAEVSEHKLVSRIDALIAKARGDA